MPSTSFRFGSNSEHEVKVECGLFGGEKYLVDGSLVLSHWSLRPSGTRRFIAHGHNIEIRVSVTSKAVQAEALIDGQIVATNLFASFNAMTTRKRNDPPWLIKVTIWLVIALVVFYGLKFFERDVSGVHAEQQGST